jgi:hypothetical protein
VLSANALHVMFKQCNLKYHSFLFDIVLIRNLELTSSPGSPIVTVLCLIFHVPLYRATTYRVVVLLLCAHVIIVCVIVLFTCFCFCIFVFLYFDNMCVDVSFMREAGYIRSLSCVHQWHR